MTTPHAHVSPTSSLQKVGGLAGNSLAYFIATQFPSGVVLLPPHLRLSELAAALRFFLNDRVEVCLYPAFESVYSAVKEDPKTAHTRLSTLARLIERSHKPCFVLTNPLAFFQRTIPAELFKKSVLTATKGQWVERDKFISHLGAIGYVRDELAEDQGFFSVRGHLIDVFTPYQGEPFRVEFFGDEIVSIRSFNSATQRSTLEHSEIKIYPVRELCLLPEFIPEFRQRLKDRGDELQVSRDDRELILQQIEQHRELSESRALLPALFPHLVLLRDYLPKNLPVILVDAEEAAQQSQRAIEIEDRDYANCDRLVFAPETLRSARSSKEFDSAHELFSKMSTAPINYQVLTHENLRPRILQAKNFVPLITEMREQQAIGHEVFFIYQNERKRLALSEALAGEGLTVHWAQADSFDGFSSKTIRRAYFTERDVFGTKRGRKTSSSTSAAKDFLREFSDLKTEDFVVHVEHGVARYRGLITLEVGKTTTEFAFLEYAEGDKLYLPIYRLDQISRYVGADTQAVPRLDRLGSKVFLKKKQKAREDILRIAHELMEIASRRKLQKMDRGVFDSKVYNEFCEAFPFELTSDQESTLRDIESDFRSPLPMDRLVCGDVGFGKTEVALRAAMIRLLQGAQVAVLAPTTLLVDQHFKNFSRRLSPFQIRVAHVSRFVTPKEQAKTLMDLREGRVDLIVGTHRLLQNDVEFKNLGLLIVDEEQRFGVKHKERIKKISSHVDVMSLSATPIPRTLQMAVVGIRELSLITTAPENRESVQTYVGAYDEHLIREAALRELRRGGQVLFVHNRVKSIEGVAESLRKLLPEFRIAVGHGQMNEEDLEKIMLQFVDRHYDLLLATSIIENGLDIPNANTIFIDHSEQFGLSDLYQIRGRVGRSFRQAYAYFMIRDETPLTNEASKRLQVIQTYTELGSGFKVASHDLEIRGSGNLLGEEQSGVVAEVGLELYNELLLECLHEIKKEQPAEPLPEMNFSYSAYIPESYIPDASIRISTYRRLNRLSSPQELLEFEDEVLDRFGLYPSEFENLSQITRLRTYAHALKARALDIAPGRVVLELRASTPLDPNQFLKAKLSGTSIDPKGRLIFNFESALENSSLLNESKFKRGEDYDFQVIRDFFRGLFKLASISLD